MIIRNKIAVVIFLLMLFPITYTSETNEAFVKNDTEISSERNFGEQIRGKQPYTGTIPTTCFVGPDSAYQVVMDSLNNAIWSFYLEVYTLSSQPLVNALIDAVNRGVDVQVSLSHDRVNPYEDNYTLEAAYRLDQAGILVTWCSSSFAYTHAKFWIVDSETAYIYSGNWAPSSIPQYSQAYENREMGLAFQNTDIATYFENLFFDDQAIGNPYAGTEPHNGELQDNTTSGSYSPQFFEESFNEYTEVLPVISPDNSYTEIHSLLESANVSINVELQYIKFDCEFLDDLLAAAQRGVSIKVLIPEPGSTNENVTETLLSYGIEVRFFAGLKHNHNKYINVDGEIVCISSINWSNNSVVNNREAGAIVKNTNIANYFSEVFNYDWGKAELPSGLLPVSFVDPKIGGIISDEDTIQVSFSGYNYTQAEFFINNSLVHTWINPSGIESFHIDTTSFSNGIHTMKVVGDVESATDITIQGRVNIIDTTELGVVISEIRFDAATEPQGEFLEIYNNYKFDIALDNWILTDNEDTFRIPEDTTITKENIFILVRDSTVFTDEMTDLGVTIYTPDLIYGELLLANSGDEVLLEDSSENIIDAVAWGSGSVSGVISWSGTMDAESSLQRDPANKDTDDCSVDFIKATPNPGEVYIEETPGFIPGFVFSITILSIIIATIIRKRQK